MAVVRLERLTKSYGSVRAVDDLSLTCEDGEIVGLLGPSGCGKTTTLGIVAGFHLADSGSILVDGKAIHEVSPDRRNMGMVFQSYALFPHLTVEENVAFGLKMRRIQPAIVERRVGQALGLVKLAHLSDRYPKQLSGGQQQRVALARALVIEPSVLLLDEPLSNLDAALREEMRFEIREIQRRIGITTIFVTHDQQEAMAVCDRIAIMDHGRIIQEGSPAAIYSTPRTAFVARFLGQANLLPGVVREPGPELASVGLSHGSQVLRARSTAVAGRARGQRVMVVVRPEHITLSEAARESGPCLEARIVRVSYLGSITRVIAEANGTRLEVAATHLRPEIAPGAVAYLVWDEHDSVLVPDAMDESKVELEPAE